jgi:hypothetical protein
VLLRQTADEDGGRGMGLQAVQARAGQLRVLSSVNSKDSQSLAILLALLRGSSHVTPKTVKSVQSEF